MQLCHPLVAIAHGKNVVVVFPLNATFAASPLVTQTLVQISTSPTKALPLARFLFFYPLDAWYTQREVVFQSLVPAWL